MPPDCVGLPLAARLAPMGDGRHVFASPATPLDDAALAVAQGFIRPGGRGLSNALRCAEAVYRHVVRHGGPEIPGLNRPPEDGLDEDAFPIGPEDSELDALAHGWAELDPGTEPPSDEVQIARSLAGPAAIMEALVASAMARDWDRDRLADAYARVALLQMETLELREATGIFAGRLDAVAAAIDRAIADVDLPPSVRALFDTLRLRIGVAPSGGQGSRDADLDRLVQRIQALRAKTVDQGCTEQEALAAAEKVAELLDRHGLSLSELELRRQACEGIGIDTGRRRTGPIDDCVPAIAEFFDCHAWGEKTASGALRYIFFGLSGDVEAARYLYELIDRAFETETRTPSTASCCCSSRTEPSGAVQQSALLGGLGHGGTERREHFRLTGEELPHAPDNKPLDVAGRDASAGRGGIPAPGDQRPGHVVAVPSATP